MPTKKTHAANTLVIDETIPIGHLEVSDTKAFDIYLIRSKINRYVAINNMIKTKSDSDWKTKKAMWLPFDKVVLIADMIIMASEKGNELGWDKPIAEPEISSPSNDITKAIDDVQTALDKLKETIATNKNEVTQEQLSLFNKITNTLFK